MTHVEDESPVTSEMLPCPFCGEPAEVDMSRGFRALREGTIHSGVSIYCSAYCHVEMMLSRADLPEYDNDQLLAMLTEQWNHRSLGKADGVGVRELEWETVEGPHGVWWRALNPMGGMHIEATTEAEKAEKQADFNTRILSALSVPLRPDETEGGGGGETEAQMTVYYLRLKRYMQKIAALRESEGAEPFDDALDLADTALLETAHIPTQTEMGQAFYVDVCRLEDRVKELEAALASPTPDGVVTDAAWHDRGYAAGFKAGVDCGMNGTDEEINRRLAENARDNAAALKALQPSGSVK